MPPERVDLLLGAHVPHPGNAVPPSRNQNIQRRVQAEAEHPRQVTVIVPHDAVVLQVPAHHLLVLRRREEVRVTRGYRQAPNAVDVPRERELQSALRPDRSLR